METLNMETALNYIVAALLVRGESLEFAAFSATSWIEEMVREAQEAAWNEGFQYLEDVWEHDCSGHPESEGEICDFCAQGNPYEKKDGPQ